MSKNDKLKYGMEGRGALEGYADADWWRALGMDIQILRDGDMGKVTRILREYRLE